MPVTADERAIVELLRAHPFIDAKLLRLLTANEQPVMDLGMILSLIAERGGSGMMQLNGPRGGPIHSKPMLDLGAYRAPNVVPFPDPPAPEKPQKPKP